MTKRPKDPKAAGKNKSVKVNRPPVIPHGQAKGPNAKPAKAGHSPPGRKKGQS
jgi:hypothetical protein